MITAFQPELNKSVMLLIELEFYWYSGVQLILLERIANDGLRRNLMILIKGVVGAEFGAIDYTTMSGICEI
mgnify:CR=1 FL=1